MDAYEYSELLKLLNNKLKNIHDILKPEQLNAWIKAIEALEAEQEFWNDVEHATKIGIVKNRVLGKLS